MLTFPEGLTAPMSLPACPTCPFAPRPMLIDMNKVYRQTNLENLDQAFSVAERDLGVTRLLDPEGMCHFPPPAPHQHAYPYFSGTAIWGFICAISKSMLCKTIAIWGLS